MNGRQGSWQAAEHRDVRQLHGDAGMANKAGGCRADVLSHTAKIAADACGMRRAGHLMGALELLTDNNSTTAPPHPRPIQKAIAA